MVVHNGGIHGNSRDSAIAQVVYRIFDELGNTMKYGVASCKSRNSRPKKQLKKGEDYEIVDEIAAGPGARGRAYDREQDRVTDYAKSNSQRVAPPRNERPLPRR